MTVKKLKVWNLTFLALHTSTAWSVSRYSQRLIGYKVVQIGFNCCLAPEIYIASRLEIWNAKKWDFTYILFSVQILKEMKNFHILWNFLGGPLLMLPQKLTFGPRTFMQTPWKSLGPPRPFVCNPVIGYLLNLWKYEDPFTSLESFRMVYCRLTMPPQELTFGVRNFMTGP